VVAIGMRMRGRGGRGMVELGEGFRVWNDWGVM
jgi:hypothetical protein